MQHTIDSTISTKTPPKMISRVLLRLFGVSESFDKPSDESFAKLSDKSFAKSSDKSSDEAFEKSLERAAGFKSLSKNAVREPISTTG